MQEHDPVTEYHRVPCASTDEAQAIALQLMEALTAPGGTRYRSGPTRAVVWGPPLAVPQSGAPAFLYFSTGALELARGAGIDLAPDAEPVGYNALPDGLTMLLGKTRDGW